MSGASPQNFVSSNGIGAVSDANLNANTQTDSTAAQLRGFGGAIAGMACMLQGISAPGDGNGGLFYWSNGSGYVDDNLNTIVPFGSSGQGAWLRAGLTAPSGIYLLLTGGTVSGPLVAAGGFSTTNAAVSGTVSGVAFADLVPAGTNTMLEVNVLIGSAVALTTTVTATVASITLPAGAWLLYGNVVTAPASGTTTSLVAAAISTTAATLPTYPNGGALNIASGNSSSTQNFALPLGILYSTGGTYYLVVKAIFAVSTLAAYGFLGAIPITNRAT